MYTDEHYVKRYFADPDQEGAISDNRIQSLYIDRNRRLWITTWNGLNSYDSMDVRFQRHSLGGSGAQALRPRKTLCITQSQSGAYWVGTFGEGLCRFLPGSSCITYTTREGLPDNIIYGILEDKKGNLYLSTSRGLSRFFPESETFQNFKTEDGLISEEFYWGAYTKGNDGMMYFGTVNGISAFHPDSLTDHNEDFPVVLTNLKIFDREIEQTSALNNLNMLRLKPHQTHLFFQFAALDYIKSSKNTYYYMMDGLDEDWIFSGHSRFVNYSNLEPGHFTFRVRALNSRGHQSASEVSLNIHLPPPYWKTAWFRLIIGMLVLVTLYAAYRVRIAQVHKQRLWLRKKVDERTRQLRSKNQALRRAKEETDNILLNVDEGFFLLNPEFKVESQYSKSLESMFAATQIAGQPLSSFLTDHVPDETIDSCREYFELMFENEIDEETLNELNPLSSIKLYFNSQESEEPYEKYLTFRFKRIVDADENVAELFATVRDVSDQTLLAKKLEASEAEQKRQMELMFSILHVEPSLFSDFMVSVENELNQISESLQQSMEKSVLQGIYRSAHSIKGNASLLDLRFFVQAAHAFEDLIVEVQSAGDYGPGSLKQMNSQLKNLQKMFKELRELIGQIRNFQTNFRPKRRYENELMLRSIKNFVKSTAAEVRKEVEFYHSRFDPDAIPYQYRYLVKEILIQLIRNSLSHGIEQPDERTKNGKKPSGTLMLTSLVTTKTFGFKLRDDGRGIHTGKLKEKALESGTYTAEELDTWTNDQLVELMFESGISTQDRSDLVAGRGVGMDIIKNKLNRVNGTIEVDYERGAFCEFTITLPLP
jgi:HPt (histidine-containing phosphotransfer) domain-containing protein